MKKISNIRVVSFIEKYTLEKFYKVQTRKHWWNKWKTIKIFNAWEKHSAIEYFDKLIKH